MLSSGEFVNVGEVICVSDPAETLPSLSVSDSGKTSVVEIIVEFCSDVGELVDILAFWVLGAFLTGALRVVWWAWQSVSWSAVVWDQMGRQHSC